MNKKRVFVLIILILVLGVITRTIFFIKNAESEQRNNENLIKSAKCLRTCPYEKGRILEECAQACSEKYLKEIEDDLIDNKLSMKLEACF